MMINVNSNIRTAFIYIYYYVKEIEGTLKNVTQIFVSRFITLALLKIIDLSKIFLFYIIIRVLRPFYKPMLKCNNIFNVLDTI